MTKIYLYKKVMIVDDNAADLYISTAIVRNNLFAEEVVCFSSVAMALSHLQPLSSAPDSWPAVIFLDVAMQGTDGFDFLDGYGKLPEEMQRRGMIIVASAGYSRNELARLKTYPAARMFFRKPLSHKILNYIRENA